MSKLDEYLQTRRRLIVNGLSAVAASVCPALCSPALAQTYERRPFSSIFRLSGTVYVDGKKATSSTAIPAGAVVQTMSNGEIVFTQGDAAYILGANTRLITKASVEEPSLVSTLTLTAGRMLSVFGRRRSPIRMSTGNATIGIRGTGIYLEAEPQRTYFCTCYGTTEVASATDTLSRASITATQHDRPVYIVNDAKRGEAIKPAPLINHTDKELILIESLLGRSPPFVFPKDDYYSPRKSY